MPQVKIFEEHGSLLLEDHINAWLKENGRYAQHIQYALYVEPETQKVRYTALVIYQTY